MRDQRLDEKEGEQKGKTQCTKERRSRTPKNVYEAREVAAVQTESRDVASMGEEGKSYHVRDRKLRGRKWGGSQEN